MINFQTTNDKVSHIVGDENFVYYMSVWAIAYAECTNKSLYLPHYENRNELFRRVQAKNRQFKNNIMSLLQILQDDFPGVAFNFGLSSGDIIHNAYFTQVSLLLDEINSLLREIDSSISELGQQPILEYAGTSPVTPVKIDQYFKAKTRHLGLVKPEFRLGGSNGQLTILRSVSGIENFDEFAKGWLKKVQGRVHLDGASIITPNSKRGLLQYGPTNDATYLSSFSAVVKHCSLMGSILELLKRKVLYIVYPSDATFSTSNPKGINFGGFDESSHFLSLAQSQLINQYTSFSDHSGLSPLPTIFHVNPWYTMYEGLKSLSYLMSKVVIDDIVARNELENNDLVEAVRYYTQIEEGRDDPYWEMKSSKNKISIDTDKILSFLNMLSS